MSTFPNAIHLTWHDTLPNVALCQMSNNVQMSDLQHLETAWQDQPPCALIWECPQSVLLPPHFWSAWVRAHLTLLPTLITLVTQDKWSCHLINNALAHYHPDANIYCVPTYVEAMRLMLLFVRPSTPAAQNPATASCPWHNRTNTQHASYDTGLKR
jgi:hypothetical protein